MKYLVLLAHRGHPLTLELSVLERVYLRLWNGSSESSESDTDDLLDV